MQREIDSMGIGESGMAGTRLRREFASYLHGDIQSELLSASMQMSQAAETGNIKMGKKALKRADDLLKRDHQTYIVGSAIASRKKLERLAEAWRGIAEIEFVLNEKDLFSDSTFEVITDVMEELVTNAIRHGSASTIRSMIAREGGAIRVTFEDNGTEIKGRKKGLGSEILKKRTLSYHYERTSQGNRIEIELPD
jgi:two-component sensor histidine kinase